MKILDMFFLMVVAATSALSFELQYYGASIFLTLVFFLLLAAISLHYLMSPLPRFVIGAVRLPTDKDVEVEVELEDEDE